MKSLAAEPPSLVASPGAWPRRAFAGVAHAQTDTMAALYEKAKPKMVTWYTSHYPAETAERIRRAFLEQYPDIKLNLLRAVSGVVFQRVSQELKANALQCDLLGVSDMGNVIAFKEQGLPSVTRRRMPRRCSTSSATSTLTAISMPPRAA